MLEQIFISLIVFSSTTILYICVHYLDNKATCLFELSQISPIYYCDNGSMEMSTKHWWNNIWKENWSTRKETCLRLTCDHHKRHTNWSVVETGSAVIGWKMNLVEVIQNFIKVLL